MDKTKIVMRALLAEKERTLWDDPEQEGST
jgi:hypothetical protein